VTVVEGRSTWAPGCVAGAAWQHLAPLITRVRAGRLAGAVRIGVEADKIIGKYKMARHFDVTITDESLTIVRRQATRSPRAAVRRSAGQGLIPA
jgi:hypothetical protein